MPVMTAGDLAALASEAEAQGLLRLGAVSLDDPGFEPARVALGDYLDRGLEGEMGFMQRTRALRMDPRPMLAGARSALVAVVPYRGQAGPLARYTQSLDYHSGIHRRLVGLSAAVEARLPGVETLSCVDTKPVLERSFAVLAGLGSLGKNGCLIVPGLGSYVFIAVLMTTARWVGGETAADGDQRAAEGGRGGPWSVCGSCRQCLDDCPTDAFEAPGRLDPRRCIAYLTIEHRGPIPEPLAARLGVRVAGCDRCQEVCPHNQSAQREGRVPLAAWLPPPPGRAREPDLPKLATIGSNQYRQFVKHTALNRIPRRALRRNALLAIGNAAGPLDEDEQAALERCSKDAEPELAALARWAWQRRGLTLDELN